MGFYIEVPERLHKADQIIELHGALEVNLAIAQRDPQMFWDNVFDKGSLPVVVVENGPFDAAGIAYSPGELRMFISNPADTRPKRMLLLTWEKIRELSPFCPLDGRD